MVAAPLSSRSSSNEIRVRKAVPPRDEGGHSRTLGKGVFVERVNLSQAEKKVPRQ